MFAWVNDEDTKRAYESGADAYRVFRRMLERGHPPDAWSQLLAEARADAQRLQRLAAGRPRSRPTGGLHMARVADYSIVTDEWVLEASQNFIKFDVPSTIDAGSRPILAFMLHVDTTDDMTLVLRINGTQVWNWTYAEGRRTQFYQEVIPAGLVKPGTNVLRFDSSSDGFRLVKLSDVVVWWQANI